MKWKAEWAGCVLYAAIASLFIANGPGLQYDEALLAHGAVHVLYGHDMPPFVHEVGSWLPVGGKALPLMVMSYIGPAKDYVLLPLIAIFGTSTALVRIGSGLMTLFLVWSAGRILRRHRGPACAVAGGCIIAMHPVFVVATTLDNSGIALWMLTLGLTSMATDAFAAAPDRKRAFLTGAAAAFAVWCRANCIWFVAAIVVSVVIVFRRELRLYLRYAPIIAAGTIVGAAPFILFQFASRGAILKFLQSRHVVPDIGERLREVADILVMGAEQRAIWNGVPPPRWQTVIVAILAIASVISAAVSKHRFSRIVALVTIMTAIAMLTSNAPVTEHHLLGLIPLIAACGATAATAVQRRFVRIGITAAVAIYAFIAVAEIARDVRALRATGGVDDWSDAIDVVSRSAEARRADILDWGLYNNLYVLSDAQLRGHEIFWTATEMYSGRGLSWRAEVAHGGAYLIPSRQVFPDARQGFLRELHASQARYAVQHFTQRNGASYAELYIVTARVPTLPSPPRGTGS